MGLFDYLRRRRERESALSAQQLAALDPSATDPSPAIAASAPDGKSPPRITNSSEESIAAAIREASSGGGQSLPSAIHDAFRYMKVARTGSAVEGLDYEKLKELQDSLMKVMEEHGIDPTNPDASRFMDPEVQRALQDAVLKHGLQDES
jgi:hypothetical protein